MGSSAKPNAIRLYETLLQLYPASFRRYYGKSMAQTFRDMLSAEPSPFGRGLIWARALADLPPSAAREHLTEGKDITMNRTTKILLGAALAVLILANGLSFWFGSLHARQTAGVERVTVAQLADAMQQDNFYSSYGGAAVLFSGKVTRVQQKDGVRLVTFGTGRPYDLECQIPGDVGVKAGATLSIVAPAGSAERLSHGVLLHNCLVN